MSFFTESNKDAKSIGVEQASAGPVVGFFKGFEYAYQAQTRAAAVYGIQAAMWDEEDQQVQAMRRAGIEDVPVLTPGQSDFWQGLVNPGNEYLDAARFYENGGDPAVADQLSSFDKRIEDLRAKYPDLGLQTSREMWDTVRSKAQAAEANTTTARNDFGGAVGGFLGGTIAALNPNTDPWNFATLPVGGAGRNVLTRVLGQGLAQGVIESINQFTGVSEQRGLLGLDNSLADAATRVGGAAIGGALVQGAGELFSFGVKRMFRSRPADPVPDLPPPVREAPPAPVTVPQGVVPADPAIAARSLVSDPARYAAFLHEYSPYSGTRAGKARTVLDLDYTASRLDDWTNVERPWELPPRTDTAPPQPGNFVKLPDLKENVARANVDMIARRVDPDTFRKYDVLADEKRAYKIRLDQEAAARPKLVESNAELARIGDDIARVDDKIARAGAMKAKKLRTQKAELVAERDALMQTMNEGDTSNMAAMRAAMMRVDERMRDLAPLVSRAYARAKSKWDVNSSEHEAVIAMIREGRKDIQQNADFVDAAQNYARTIVDEVPILARAPEVAATLKKDADAIDTMSAIIAKDAEVLEESVERMRASLPRLLEPVDAKAELEPEALAPDEIKVEGYDKPLHLDRDTIDVPVEDGEGTRTLTLRQFLTEQLEREEDLAAVTSCSIPKIL